MAASQHALADPERLGDLGRSFLRQRSPECVLGGRDGGVAAGVEGREILLLVGAGGFGKLGQQRLEPDAQLKRRLPVSPLVEVRVGSQQQRLADVDWLAAGEHRRQPLLRAQGLGAPLAPRRRRDLHRLLPATLGEPVAGAVAGSDDQSGVACDLVAVRVLSRNPVRSQHGVHAPKPGGHGGLGGLGVASLPLELPAASSGSDGSAGITVTRVTGTSGGGPGSARRARRMRRGPRTGGAPRVCTTTTVWRSSPSSRSR